MFFLFPFIFEGVFAIVFVVVIITIVRTAIKNKERHNMDSGESKSFKNTISNANDDSEYWNSISSVDTSIKCAYCGSSVMRSRKKCPSCGAKIDKTTNKK